MYYKDDRKFTDTQHKINAVPYIYDKLGWKEKVIDNELNELRDSFSAIDYEFTDSQGKKIFVQERFRKNKYSNYNDFTLRYERPENEDVMEQKSEFYKIITHLKRRNEPFYLVYAFEPPKGEALKKFAVVDLRTLFAHINSKEICIADSDENVSPNCKMKIIIKENRDRSSTFVCFDINELMDNFSDVVFWQKGFSED